MSEIKENSRLIIKNLPAYLDERSLKERLEQYGKVTDCKIMFRGQKNRRFAFAGFMDKKSAIDAKNKLNNSYIDTFKLNVQFSTLKKAKKRENPKNGVNENLKGGIKPEYDPLRLFVKNFPYDISESDLKNIFETYGEVCEVKILVDRSGRSKGLGFIGYQTENSSIKAIANLDNKIIFGRILHVDQCFKRKEVPRFDLEQNKKEMIENEKSSFKKLKKARILEKLNDSTSWNSFFLNPNTIIEKISEKLGIEKKEMFDKDIENPAVLQTTAEHQVIQETREFLKENDVDLKCFDLAPEKTERSLTTILIKNIPYFAVRTKLLNLFSNWGNVTKFLLAPNKSIAIVDFFNNEHAKNAFQMLSNYNYQSTILYLEWAPKNIFNDTSDLLTKKDKIHKSEVTKENEKIMSKTVFVKNLNFETTEEELENFLKEKGMQNIVNVKIVNKDGISRGFGFIEFENNPEAEKMIKTLQKSILNKHVLNLSISLPKTNLKKKKVGTVTYKNVDKLIVRNIAFQANKKELEELLSNLIVFKKVRLPKKVDGSLKGFAFVEFISVEECHKGYESLKNLHFYGRKLAVDFARE